MTRLAFAALAAQLFPRIFSVRKRTLVGTGIALIIVLGLFIWAIYALLVWFFGWVFQTIEQAPELTRQAQEKIEVMAPGVQKSIGEAATGFFGGIRNDREVSGEDIAPVPRIDGFVRVRWLADGDRTVVEYRGDRGIPEVVSHYRKGFSDLRYGARVISASTAGEVHMFWKPGESWLIDIRGDQGKTLVRIDRSVATKGNP